MKLAGGVSTAGELAAPSNPRSNQRAYGDLPADGVAVDPVMSSLPDDPLLRTVRGGTWGGLPFGSRVSARTFAQGSVCGVSIGFRPALAAR